METDKLTVRERLIDFAKWWDDDFGYQGVEYWVDEYLERKSINQSSNEALTLDTIEGKKKKCEKYNDIKECKIHYAMIEGCYECEHYK
jgi:hypothetical protein